MKTSLSRLGLLLAIVLTFGGLRTPALLMAAEEKPRAIVVTAIPGDRRPFTVTETSVSADGTAATVRIESKMGIFAFHFEVPPGRLTKFTLLVKKERYCEGLTYSSQDGKSTELTGFPGVSIQPRGADLAIEFSGKAFTLLKAGGQIQFINQYRN